MLSNGVWALILVVVLVGLTSISWYVNRAAFLVIVCHNVIWAGAILLIGTNLIAYKESSAAAWLTLTFGIAFFNVGVWLARRPIGRWWPWARRPGRVTPDTADRAPARVALVTRRTLLVVTLIYAVAFGAYLVNIAVRFGLLELITSPASIRGFHGESYLESVPFVVRVFLYLGPLLFAIFGWKSAVERPLPLWVRAVALVLLTGSMLALLQRTNLFMAVLWLIAILITQSRKRAESAGHDESVTRRGGFARKARVAFPVVGFVLVAFIAFQAVGGALHKSGQQAESTGAVSPALIASGLTSPYTYYTAGTVAFLQLVDSNNHGWPPVHQQAVMVVGNYNPQTWGAATFAPILKAVPGSRPWASIDPYINTGVLTNVYTWLVPYYRDFRLPGVAIAMFLLGLLIARLYMLRFRSARIFWIQSAFISTIFLATFATKINNTLFVCEVIFVFLLTIDPTRLSTAWRTRGLRKELVVDSAIPADVKSDG